MKKATLVLLLQFFILQICRSQSCFFWPKFTTGSYTAVIPFGNTISFEYSKKSNLTPPVAYNTMKPDNWFKPAPTVVTTSPPNLSAHTPTDMGAITIYPATTGGKGTISFSKPTTTGFYLHVFQTISKLDFDHSFTLISSDGDLHVDNSGTLTSNVLVPDIGPGVSDDDANATIFFAAGVTQINFTFITHKKSSAGDGIKLAFTFPDSCVAIQPKPVIKAVDTPKFAAQIIPPLVTKIAPTVIKKRENKILKQLEVKSDSIRIELYDNKEIDGDSVTVMFNDKIITTHQRLTDKPISFTIKLERGSSRNELVMYAENLGSIPPNTALMIIYDGKKRYELNIRSSTDSNGVVVFKLKE